MRALLLILGAVFTVAAVLLLAAGVPSGLLLAGFVAVAMAFLVLAAKRVRQAVTRRHSRTYSVTRMLNPAGASRRPRVPAPAGPNSPEGRVA